MHYTELGLSGQQSPGVLEYRRITGEQAMNEPDIIELATYGQRYEAEFTREILLENGIESIIKAEAVEGVIYSFPGNYSVFVSIEDFNRAEVILESFNMQAEEEGEERPEKEE